MNLSLDPFMTLKVFVKFKLEYSKLSVMYLINLIGHRTLQICMMFFATTIDVCELS